MPQFTAEVFKGGDAEIAELKASGRFGCNGVTPPARAVVAAASAAALGAAVAATPATSTTPFGFTTGAQADALVARVNEVRTLGLELQVLLNQLRAALIAAGIAL